jgi:hypothetical protein
MVVNTNAPLYHCTEGTEGTEDQPEMQGLRAEVVEVGGAERHQEAALVLRLWEGPRGRGHMSSRTRTKCEDCAKKPPTFGLLGDTKKMRWGNGCAKAHVYAVNMSIKDKCEDYVKKRPSYGVPGDTKLRWCSGCAKAHVGAVNMNVRKKSTRKQCTSSIRRLKRDKTSTEAPDP